MAYERRDSVKYKELYDSSYVGTSTDLSDAGTRIFSLTDEFAHIGAIARSPGLRAYLELGPEATWPKLRLPSDDPSHPEWAVFQISGSVYYVRIDDVNQGESIEARGDAGTFQKFTFAPTLDGSSPTDTLWKVVRWQELGDSDPAPSP